MESIFGGFAEQVQDLLQLIDNTGPSLTVDERHMWDGKLSSLSPLKYWLASQQLTQNATNSPQIDRRGLSTKKNKAQKTEGNQLNLVENNLFRRRT